MTVDGIDVSKWQPRIDWTKAAASGRSFAFIKASEGVGYTDPRFAAHWAGAREAGLLVGAYHFARVNASVEQDARREADWFAQVMTGVGAVEHGALVAGVLPAVLDIEWDKRADGIPPTQVVKWCTTFLEHIEAATKRTPIVYCGPSFWKYKLAQTDALHRYRLWEVNYTTRTEPRPMGAWPWTFWQHSAKGKVPGVAGKADVDRFNGTMTALRELAGMAAPH